MKLECCACMETETKTKGVGCMNTSESIVKIAGALAKFQGDIENPKNIANNPFFKSKYAPLNEILNVVRPALAKYELAILQTPSISESGSVTVTTLITHSSGEFIESAPIQAKPEKPNVQGLGSTITYLRRYSLSAMLNISSEDDDDGNGASPSNKPKSKSTKQPAVNKELESAIAKIDTVAKEKAKINKEQVTKAIKDNHSSVGSANYNTITTVVAANNVLKALESIK